MLLTIGTSGQVLDLFAVSAPEWGVTETARELGLSKSKAHALLASLADVGLLRRTAQGRYRLGWRLAGLNGVLAETTDFQRHARPVLEALCARFRECVQIGTLEGRHVAFVDRVKPSRSAGAAMALPWLLPAHCSAAGKVLLSQLPDRDLDQLVNDRLEAVTGATITTATDLSAELARTRRTGTAIDRGEAIPGLWSVAAAVVGGTGEAVAAVCLTTSARRFEARGDVYKIAVRRAADYVTRQLGGGNVTALPTAAVMSEPSWAYGRC